MAFLSLVLSLRKIVAEPFSDVDIFSSSILKALHALKKKSNDIGAKILVKSSDFFLVTFACTESQPKASEAQHDWTDFDSSSSSSGDPFSKSDIRSYAPII